MKITLKHVLTIILLSLFALSCTKAKITEKAEWKGEIEYEDGVKVVKNPAEPVYGEITFELKEELSIGNEEDDNYMFYQPKKIDVPVGKTEQAKPKQ